MTRKIIKTITIMMIFLTGMQLSCNEIYAAGEAATNAIKSAIDGTKSDTVDEVVSRSKWLFRGRKRCNA